MQLSEEVKEALEQIKNEIYHHLNNGLPYLKMTSHILQYGWNPVYHQAMIALSKDYSKSLIIGHWKAKYPRKMNVWIWTIVAMPGTDVTKLFYTQTTL